MPEPTPSDTGTTIISLHSPRRKFARMTRAKKTAVDVALRIEMTIGGRLEPVRVRGG